MYEGIKAILKLANKVCDSQSCSSKCVVYDNCKNEDWEQLREDLKQLGIEPYDVGMPV